MGKKFLGEVEARKSMNDGKLKVVDINKKQSEVEVKELKSLSQVVEGLKEKFPGLVPASTPPSSSTTRSGCPAPPPPASSPASSRSSRSPPRTRASSRPCPASTCPC